VALDYGITEFDFWNMTIAELARAIESKKRIKLLEAKEKASNDYILANLIGKSISRIYSASSTYPDISEVYPSLFDSEEIQEEKQKQKDELSALRFMQFAQNYKKKSEEVDK
jgi:hypothetical protein